MVKCWKGEMNNIIERKQNPPHALRGTEVNFSRSVGSRFVSTSLGVTFDFKLFGSVRKGPEFISLRILSIPENSHHSLLNCRPRMLPQQFPIFANTNKNERKPMTIMTNIPRPLRACNATLLSYVFARTLEETTRFGTSCNEFILDVIFGVVAAYGQFE